MRILTKEERELIRRRIELRGEGAFQFDGQDMLRALDTIDALEAERDQALNHLKNSEATLIDIEGLLFQSLEKTGRNGNGMDAYEMINALEAEVKDLLRRAETAEATQDAVAMMLAQALASFADECGVTGEAWVERAAMRCPPAEEAHERTRKFAAAFDQILHPNGRCECEVNGWLCDWCAHPCEMCGIPRATGCGCDSECLGCREYAEQVRDLSARLKAWFMKALSTNDMIKKVLFIARANHGTRTVGGAHAALREILAVIEGADEEGDQ